MDFTVEQFTRIYRQKIIYNKRKRLEAIERYFINRRDNPINFEQEDTDGCLREILEFVANNPGQEQQVYSDIIDLLYDRYSIGNPYIVFDATFPEESSYEEVLNELRELLRDKIEYEMFDFEAEPQFELDRNASVIKISCRYVEYKRDIIEDCRSDEIANSGQIPIVINRSRNKVLINTGYQKAANALVRKINMSIGRTMGLSQVDIEDEASRMPNLVGITNFHPLTLLAIKLLLVELNNNHFVIQDILSISFNNDEALRVKNARLGGNQLLGDQDVIHRIYRGDKVTHFVVNVTHLGNTGNADLSADILFDFRNGFKVTLNEANEYGNYTTENAVMDIQQIVRQAISNPNTVSDAKAAIISRIPNLTTEDREVYRMVLREIKDSLKQILTTDNDIVEEYFSRNFGV